MVQSILPHTGNLPPPPLHARIVFNNTKNVILLFVFASLFLVFIIAKLKIIQNANL